MTNYDIQSPLYENFREKIMQWRLQNPISKYFTNFEFFMSSCSLFILCMDPLIRKVNDDNEIEGLNIGINTIIL